MKVTYDQRERAIRKWQRYVMRRKVATFRSALDAFSVRFGAFVERVGAQLWGDEDAMTPDDWRILHALRERARNDGGAE